MSGDRISSTPGSGFPPRDPGATELSEMETLRILGRTGARYREQIDRQQQQLDGRKSEEGAWIRAADPQCPPSWIKACPDLLTSSWNSWFRPMVLRREIPKPRARSLNVKLKKLLTEPLTQRPEESTGQRSPQQQDEVSLPPLFSWKVCRESVENRGLRGHAHGGAS